MTLSEPTKSTRDWLRTASERNAELKAALKGVSKAKRQKLAKGFAASRPDLSQKVKLRQAARFAQRGQGGGL